MEILIAIVLVIVFILFGKRISITLPKDMSMTRTGGWGMYIFVLLLFSLAVWSFAPDGTIDFVKKYYPLGVMVFVMVVSFTLAAKEMKKVSARVNTPMQIVCVTILIVTSIMFIVKFFKLAGS